MSKINPIILSDIETISDDETISEDEYSEKDEQNFNENEEPIAFFTKYLSVPEVIHSALPIEYPKTSPQGVATIFNITGWANPITCFNDIQYSNNGTGGSTTIQNCPYFGVSVKKDVRKCQGIKHCSFADPNFINEQHNEVDMESETFIKLNQHKYNNNKKVKTYIFYLAAKSTTCKYEVNDQFCNGQAKLRRIIKNRGEESFIGCDKWIRGEKWHRYIKVQEEIDLELLRDLFQGRDVPPPPPEHTPVGIRDELQTMIQNIITSDDSVTPRSIIAKNNSINANFDKDTLSEVHASLNNVDKLRTLVAKCYKNMHPYGQGNLGVMHSVQCKKFDMHNYVRRIEQFEDGQTLILCMLDFQAKALQNLNEKPVKFYHIDGTGWKCILGDLDPGQAKGLGLALEKRDPSRNWEEHLTYIFKSCLVHFNRNLIAKKFDNEVHLLAKSIPTRSSVEEVHEYFKKLELYDNKRIIGKCLCSFLILERTQ
ncbi:uncharacterized protein OCT59_015971 [Rhizophagus irregularis]|uniref:uncharacterized protein n=1 Tax=Rhizophagus irregularis TaxID=588596 RepID=UPI001A0CD9D2|nr:hypothetical protein OCT59_015971 [Rhizophagus irregularis]GBC30835.2 hypothetical protein GLOIN_2v1798242 [Rhizophagus irregularis DAOM 181602=DAOM 197198]